MRKCRGVKVSEAGKLSKSVDKICGIRSDLRDSTLSLTSDVCNNYLVCQIRKVMLRNIHVGVSDQGKFDNFGRLMMLDNFLATSLTFINMHTHTPIHMGKISKKRQRNQWVYIYIYIYIYIYYRNRQWKVSIFLSISQSIYLSIYLLKYIYTYIYINFFSSYNVWKHVRYPALISHQPGI